MGPGAMPLEVDAGTGAVADARGMVVVFGARDSLCKARRRMSRWLQRATRSATVAELVVAVTRSFLSL